MLAGVGSFDAVTLEESMFSKGWSMRSIGDEGGGKGGFCCCYIVTMDKTEVLGLGEQRGQNIYGPHLSDVLVGIVGFIFDFCFLPWSPNLSINSMSKKICNNWKNRKSIF